MSDDRRDAHVSNAVLLGLAAVVLGHALQLNNGFFDQSALWWLSAAVGLTLIGTLGRLRAPSVLTSGTVGAILTAGLIVQLVEMFVEPPGMYLRVSGSEELGPFTVGVVAAMMLAIASNLRTPTVRVAWFPVLLGVHFAQGIWLIHMSPNPSIDVVVVHREAIAALVQGHNPYAISFPNIYPDTSFYPPDLVVDGRVQFGFPYPPLGLLFVAPGELLFGDYRYTNLASLTLAAVLIGYSAPANAARLAAAVFLYTPRVFFVLEQGWTEPIVVLALAATVYCAVNAPRWTFVALGCLMVAKQYLLLGVPLAWLLVPRAARPKDFVSLLWKAGAVATLITAPFVLWDPPAFLRSVVLLQIYEPLRPDSLSYLSLWARHAELPGTTWPSVLVAAAALGTVLWRCPPTVASFAAGLALITFLLFAFGKKAFCNYYFFVIGALSCATALAGLNEGRRASASRSHAQSC